jgi:hypothetical protein
MDDAKRERKGVGTLAVAAAVLTACGAAAVSSTLSTTRSTRAAGSSLPRSPNARQEGTHMCTDEQVANRPPPMIRRPATLPSSQPAPRLIALHGACGNPPEPFQRARRSARVQSPRSTCGPRNSEQDLSYTSSMITQLTGNANVAGQIDPGPSTWPVLGRRGQRVGTWFWWSPGLEAAVAAVPPGDLDG